MSTLGSKQRNAKSVTKFSAIPSAIKMTQANAASTGSDSIPASQANSAGAVANPAAKPV